MSTAPSDEKLREWARELMGRMCVDFGWQGPVANWETDPVGVYVAHAGESLVRQCAEIARNTGEVNAKYMADEILREFGLDKEVGGGMTEERKKPQPNCYCCSGACQSCQCDQCKAWREQPAQAVPPHTCQYHRPDNYTDGPCDACAKEKYTGLDDGPPNSICQCGRGVKCPIHPSSKTAKKLDTAGDGEGISAEQLAKKIDKECWMVIRRYRHKYRVLSMHDSLSDAAKAYDRVISELRDGDVILSKAILEKVKVQCGGYNRQASNADAESIDRSSTKL